MSYTHFEQMSPPEVNLSKQCILAFLGHRQDAFGHHHYGPLESGEEEDTQWSSFYL